MPLSNWKKLSKALIWDVTVFTQSFGQVSQDEVRCNASNSKGQRTVQGEKERNWETETLKYILTELFVALRDNGNPVLASPRKRK